jgi:hypothetical protein
MALGSQPAAARPGGPTSAPVDEAAIRASLGELGPRFSEHQTPHFVIASSATPRRTQELARQAEQTFDAVREFARTTGLPFRPPSVQMTVVYFGNWEAYAERARQAGLEPSEAVPGFFDPAFDRCYVLDYTIAPHFREQQQALHKAMLKVLPRPRPASAPADADHERQAAAVRSQQARFAEYEGVINATVIRHEIAHQVLDNVGLRVPNRPEWRWLREGLAMQLESETPLNLYRLADLRAAEAKHGAIGIRDLLEQPELFDPASPRAPEAYAVAWGLVYYLAHTQTAAFARFVQGRLSSPDAPPTAQSALTDFETAFGPVHPAFEAAWGDYLRSVDRSVHVGKPTTASAGAATRPNDARP